MAELEIHHEVEGHDPLGKKVGVLAALLAVALLAIVTIVSHRAHTDAVLIKSEANDKWSFYQSKRIKFHSLELGEDLLNALPGKTPQGRQDTRNVTRKRRFATPKSRKKRKTTLKRRTKKPLTSKNRPSATTSAKAFSKSVWS